MDKQNVAYSYKGSLVKCKKQCSDIYYNMDEPWKHHTEWNKPDTKGHILARGGGSYL
jgi:hypothetical protein